LNKNSTGSHIPVLITEVIDLLQLQKGSSALDCTLGMAGHAQAMAQQVGPTGAIYGLEVDARNLELIAQVLKENPTIHPIHTNFEDIVTVGERIHKERGRLDAILMDLGLSSMHVDEAERGFSFLREGPLDMRFDQRQELTAGEIVNTYPVDSLIHIFKVYGDEPFAQRIAYNLVEYRKHSRFKNTRELAAFVSAVVASRNAYYHKRAFTDGIWPDKERDRFELWAQRRKRHPATRVFQALRIATNRELEVLESGLRGALEILSPGGRIAVISYHSHEDRLVKNIFKEGKLDKSLHLITKKPIIPTPEEVEENPRARSAKLRVAEKNQQN